MRVFWWERSKCTAMHCIPAKQTHEAFSSLCTKPLLANNIPPRPSNRVQKWIQSHNFPPSGIINVHLSSFATPTRASVKTFLWLRRYPGAVRQMGEAIVGPQFQLGGGGQQYAADLRIFTVFCSWIKHITGLCKWKSREAGPKMGATGAATFFSLGAAPLPP